MSAVTFGLLSAVANGIGAVLSKQLTVRLPARQLIGPLFALNGALLLPAAPFVAWHWSPRIVLLHAVSAAVTSLTALAVWDLFDHGAASATTTAQSLSPLPAVLGTALLVPEAFDPVQAVAAIVVVVGVMGTLSRAFDGLGQARSAWTVAVAASGTGAVTVLGRMLVDAGAGVVEIYVVRTLLAAALFLCCVPPRDVPFRELPRLAVRAVFVTAHFVLILFGVREGSPAAVQTMVATAPLLVVGLESVRDRRPPGARSVLAAGLALAGVALLL